ncbi:DUF4139 domain-containing protein [Sphingobacterium sp. LRF_L2]|uniref:DUF4139 domain-containing protein n=1 Tax=Sphingobacterium sp. LRF_L2 TaxID=3369421 RepID=UPI003F5D5F57
MKGSLLVLFFVLCIVQDITAQSAVVSFAKIKEVTVFTNGAEMVNTVDASIPRGNVKLVIHNIANDLDIRSVQLGGPSDITVNSVSLDEAATPVIANATHKQLQDSLDLLNKQKQLFIIKKSANEGAQRILNNDKLIPNGETKLDISSISGLLDYYQKKSVDLGSESSTLDKKIVSLDSVIALLATRIQSYIGSSKQLIVYLNSQIAGNISIRLSYQTQEAQWTPYYDIRAKSIKEPLSFIHKAYIYQNTGVDWKNVKLILSSANPSQGGDAPVLKPSYAGYFVERRNAEMQVNDALQGRVAGVMVNSKATRSKEEKETVDLLAVPAATASENQLSKNFEIEALQDILSNGQSHSVSLNAFTHPAEFKYYAVPKLDKDAFLVAEVKDYERLNLIPGEANVFFENMYVGKSVIDANITSDTLRVSMGRDKAIKIDRERIVEERNNQTIVGGKRQHYSYQLTVKNNKSVPVQLLLEDQYPISTDKSIDVSLDNSGNAEVDKETGVLSWNLNLQPGESKTIKFSFQIKSPKNSRIIF